MALVGTIRRFLVVSLALAAAVLGGAGGALFGVCGPFTDVAADAFCPFVLEVFTLGITTGTTPTTYDPTSAVNRLQMAAFLSRTVDGVVKRGHTRAALERFWNPQNDSVLALTSLTTVGGFPRGLRSDGVDVWVASSLAGTVSRIRVGDGKLLETWTDAAGAADVVLAMGRVIVAGRVAPGRIYTINPTEAAGAVTTVATNVPDSPRAIAFDGARVWTANEAGSISIATPGAIPWTVTTPTTGFIPADLLYDGANMWAPDVLGDIVIKLDSAGAILQTITVGSNPSQLAFDGTNIWVTNRSDDTVTVFRASSGAVLRTLTGNGMKEMFGVAFDGERVLVTNYSGDSVSLWKAADLTPLGSFPMPAGSAPHGACSDGTSFWIALNNVGKVVRF
jgi:hypothetical protein